MNDLARLSAAQRQQMIDEFVDATFEGTGGGGGIAAGMRALPAELPDDPSTEQVEAWVELAELVADESFRARVREMAVTGANADAAPAEFDPGPVREHAGAALAAGVDPASAEGRAVLDRIVPPDLDGPARAELADRITTFSDRRVERYWQLMGTLNGRDPFPPSVPAFEWLAAALRA